MAKVPTSCPGRHGRTLSRSGWALNGSHLFRIPEEEEHPVFSYPGLMLVRARGTGVGDAGDRFSIGSRWETGTSLTLENV